ncbi:MarR family winged helix-turn-helix transcriptional regulator [Bosea sp. (in: a-proteobacteria)]|jgi:DNA-binding MarR family transcriptional regulator|uniref:MarR family winged helix-turn-helix transcriptional regulator n=1 Tax=Bosea sp. (in: a-proteobacteria) TaxID=1871050 RepID=UPI003F6EE683
MSMEDVYQKPGHLIRRAQQIAVSIFLEECAPLDMTPVQYAALVAVRDNPGIDATRLSALVAFDRSTLGNVLERMETKGLIVRSGDKQDKRVKILRLSPKGATALKEVEPLARRAQERILGPLAPEDREIFMRMLSQLVELNNEASRAPLKLAVARSSDAA